MSPPRTHKPINEPVLWSTVLHPHRSHDRVPLLLITILVCGSGFVTAVAFLSMGAWPVFGFLGLDVLLLVFAIRLNLRRAKAHETLTLTDKELHIDRVDPWGRHRHWSVPPHWLRVVLTPPAPHQPALELHSHGRKWTIASFLRDQEKAQLADDIRRALLKLRDVGISPDIPAP